MIIEALTFKLSLDFIKYLKKNRIDITNIRTKFFDKVQGSSEFVTYADVDALLACVLAVVAEFAAAVAELAAAVALDAAAV